MSRYAAPNIAVAPLAQTGAKAAVLASFSRFADKANIAEAGCAAIAALSMHPANRAVDAMSLVVSALVIHKGALPVAIAACAALGNLTLSEDCQHAAASTNAISAVLQILASNMKNSLVAVGALKSLRNMCSTGQKINQVGSSRVVQPR